MFRARIPNIHGCWRLFPTTCTQNRPVGGICVNLRAADSGYVWRDILSFWMLIRLPPPPGRVIKIGFCWKVTSQVWVSQSCLCKGYRKRGESMGLENPIFGRYRLQAWISRWSIEHEREEGETSIFMMFLENLILISTHWIVHVACDSVIKAAHQKIYC